MPRERVISAESQGEEEQRFGYALRPERFDQYIGQDNLLRKLKIAVNAARGRKERALAVGPSHPSPGLELRRGGFGARAGKKSSTSIPALDGPWIEGSIRGRSPMLSPTSRHSNDEDLGDPITSSVESWIRQIAHAEDALADLT